MNADRPRADSELPIAIDELSSTLEGSAVLRVARRLWHTADAALSTATVIAAAARVREALPTTESRLLAAGYALAVAMVTHLALMKFAEPYAFPGYARYWLPAALLVFAVVLIALRMPIAAAWRDRQARG